MVRQPAPPAVIVVPEPVYIEPEPVYVEPEPAYAEPAPEVHAYSTPEIAETLPEPLPPLDPDPLPEAYPEPPPVPSAPVVVAASPQVVVAATPQVVEAGPERTLELGALSAYVGPAPGVEGDLVFMGVQGTARWAWDAFSLGTTVSYAESQDRLVQAGALADLRLSLLDGPVRPYVRGGLGVGGQSSAAPDVDGVVGLATHLGAGVEVGGDTLGVVFDVSQRNLFVAAPEGSSANEGLGSLAGTLSLALHI